MIWRLLDTGSRNGFDNMAIDEAILMAHSRGKNPPTLRFYGWDPPALTLGYFQKPAGTVDFEECGRLGIDVVRRPTGGRAILHHREVTYSVIARDNNPLAAGTVEQSYLRLSRGLLLGLKRLGLDVALHEAGRRSGKGPACFDSPALYEMVVNGRKLVGNAQCRREGCVLQQGALPIVNDSRTLFKILRFPSEKEREEQRLNFSRGAISLEEALGRPVDSGEVKEALSRGFAGALGIDPVPGDLTDEEMEIAQKLGREKYRVQE